MINRSPLKDWGTNEINRLGSASVRSARLTASDAAAHRANTRSWGRYRHVCDAFESSRRALDANSGPRQGVWSSPVSVDTGWLGGVGRGLVPVAVVS